MNLVLSLGFLNFNLPTHPRRHYESGWHRVRLSRNGRAFDRDVASRLRLVTIVTAARLRYW